MFTNVAQIDHILERLTVEPQPDSAWKEFLDVYSRAILRVILKYEHDEARINDCFVFVCGKLSDNGFRRLRRYNPDRGARFTTWLSTVVANLSVDWRRSQYGRFQPVKAVRELPRLERKVFRYVYELGMTRRECLHTLEPEFPDVTERQVTAINTQLFSLLTSRQRWKLTTRGPPDSESAFEPTLADSAPSPDLLAQIEQNRDRVQYALSRLPARSRLLLRLRYQQDLSFKEIARLTGLTDTNRAYREIQSALAALRELLARE